MLPLQLLCCCHQVDLKKTLVVWLYIKKEKNKEKKKHRGPRCVTPRACAAGAASVVLVAVMVIMVVEVALEIKQKNK